MTTSKYLQIKPETKAWLEAEVVSVVMDSYKVWADYGKTHNRKEPNLTVTMVQESLTSEPSDWTSLPRSRKALYVLNALERARTAGKLGSSLGVGLNGKEARCYEPPAV